MYHLREERLILREKERETHRSRSEADTGEVFDRGLLDRTTDRITQAFPTIPIEILDMYAKIMRAI